VRITLVHNPNAGGGVDAKELKSLMEDAGHKVRTVSTAKAWRKALRKRADLVVAAGGDGTFHDVALEVAETGVPMSVLPLGTANNVGKTLEILGDARRAIAKWDGLRAKPFDLGRISAPWGNAAFIESFGGGAFASLVGSGQHIDSPSVLLGRQTDRALYHLGELLAEEKERSWSVSVDGQPHDGRYLAVEVLNIRFAGPNVPLAPDADPGDGQMEVVLMGSDQCLAMQNYIADRVRLAAGTMPALPIARGREIQLVAPAGAQLHLDDKLWPDDEPIPRRAKITIRVEAGRLQIVS
jgi:diacylglycerol kinase family enzyme